jgi:hypothetical protein
MLMEEDIFKDKDGRHRPHAKAQRHMAQQVVTHTIEI